jgi:hypothetical protein
MDSTQRQLVIRATAPPIIVGIVLAGLFAWLFAAAFHQPQAHGLAVGLVAPDQAATAITAGLEQNAPGAFSVSRYESADEAHAAIDDRSIVGAYVLAPDAPPEILVASANGQASAGAVSGAFAAIAQASGQAPLVTDVRPLPTSDPQGIVPFFLILAVSLAGLLYAILASLTPVTLSPSVRLTAMAVFAVLAGLTAAAAVGLVLAFDTWYWMLALVCIGVAWAVAATTTALAALFGRAGFGLSAILVVLLGAASSGGMVGSAFLPDVFRELAAVMPAGVGLFAARSALYFDGAALLLPILILALWILVALAVDVWAEGRHVTTKRLAPTPTSVPA